ncbi:MAG: response regulator transcription factor [Acidobacteria bacterium]|nr:response regulator transcription factor [Acidobacteriota bacterium]
MTRTRVLLAEDHAVMRDRVVGLLEPEFVMVGTVGDGQALLEAATKMQPDVIIIDIMMPILGGIEAAHYLKQAGSCSKIIFLTIHEDQDFIRAALAEGALGYVVKSRLATDLCAAIREAIAGRLFVSPSVALISPEMTGEETF